MLSKYNTISRIPADCFLEYIGMDDSMRSEYYKPSWSVPVVDMHECGMPDWWPIVSIQGIDSNRGFRVPRRDVRVLKL